ncbi:sn-glycerol-1-phosphate dehydrogenase [Paenibacillus campinasensis]|uniref:Iron-containing alcohol dehydrogenase n=1 Tax=Paenibacillus campinasensis TaxID=66347 RepID=A0A268F516_9BACL|nr:sn-glycerol-1-phosphate dehydrogenase [Paenibacillus campinasensis]MUG64472.1 iron-containing alcohol dehydrogenase [Paenibacillus campinasensis]PAD80466.1 sn-glycerol-1-phosphate dehydrogenase [Paenibacillus campinasensis]
MSDALMNARRLLEQMKQRGTAFHGLELMLLERGALAQVGGYLREQGLAQPVVVADAHTCEAAGKELLGRLKDEGIDVRLILIEPDAQGDVVADERSLMQLFIEAAPEKTGCLIAVGSGTIHDITRFVSHRSQLPFLSVPTAPSVDGFTSAGAPIIVKGVKQTFQASAPAAIFADLDVLMKAPQSLVAAGFGDMLGKYTSLFDWRHSSSIGGEPYDEQVAAITEAALLACVEHVQDIGQRSETGIRVLMTALIESGIAMLLFGQSHPASGAEHHLSHYWEMEFLSEGRRALLHGAKVGVAAAEISQLYHDAVDSGIFPYAEPEGLARHRERIQDWLTKVPSPDRLRSLLKQAGGPSTHEELGIEEKLVQRSLQEAHTLRNRHTLLRALNEVR